jgi:hypothetical protein
MEASARNQRPAQVLYAAEAFARSAPYCQAFPNLFRRRYRLQHVRIVQLPHQSARLGETVGDETADLLRVSFDLCQLRIMMSRKRRIQLRIDVMSSRGLGRRASPNRLSASNDFTDAILNSGRFEAG